MQKISDVIDLLRCPSTRQLLTLNGGNLCSIDGSRCYRLTSTGIPLFAEDPSPGDAKIQQVHYDRVAESYVANLAYPHTIEYTAYLDQALLNEVKFDQLAAVAEICCGQGEAVQLIGSHVQRGIGLDISINMLELGVANNRADSHFALIQGDATKLPIADGVLDSVFTLGGIHHINDRRMLFAEIFRVLKPGGRFYFREPCNDFFLWRLLRALIYRLSPALDESTERPLRFEETVPVLQNAGFQVLVYRTLGFLGFCLFMNSDVLIVNRLFRFIPGIRLITRAAIQFDEWLIRLPGMRRVGLQVIGCAVKSV